MENCSIGNLRHAKPETDPNAEKQGDFGEGGKLRLGREKAIDRRFKFGQHGVQVFIGLDFFFQREFNPIATVKKSFFDLYYTPAGLPW